MGANRPKRNHFVPEMLLKNFCDDRGFLWIGDQELGKCNGSRGSREEPNRPRRIHLGRMELMLEPVPRTVQHPWPHPRLAGRREIELVQEVVDHGLQRLQNH